MLKFDIQRSDLKRPWAVDVTGWAAGRSRITPFCNAALEHFAIASGDCFLVVARERVAGLGRPARVLDGEVPQVDAHEWESLLAEALAWPLQFILLVIQPSPQGPQLSIISGPWGIGPLYVISRAEAIAGSWDPIHLYPLLSAQPFDPALACHFIASFESPYSRRTMFREMHMLTERSRASWKVCPDADAMQFTIDYPPGIQTVRPERLKPDADVVEAFWRILRRSLSRWLPRGMQAGVELSGGLDSTIVALVAADLLDSPLATYGVILLEGMGESQRLRRQELVRAFNFEDLTVEMSNWIPFAPNSSRLNGGPVVPWEDVYFEALDHLLQQAAQRGTQLLFTGLGGDELCGGSDYDLTEAELAAIEASEAAEQLAQPALPGFLTHKAQALIRETADCLDTAPPALIASSAVSAAACSSAMAMRHGLWTTSPLCTPELVAFCARLPLAWREDRAVERKLLAGRGCSENVYHPPKADDFSPACRLGMRFKGRAHVRKLFEHSRLADIGLLDRDRLVADYDAWCESNSSEGDLPFYATAVLEQTLRALEKPLS